MNTNITQSVDVLLEPGQHHLQHLGEGLGLGLWVRVRVMGYGLWVMG